MTLPAESGTKVEIDPLEERKLAHEERKLAHEKELEQIKLQHEKELEQIKLQHEKELEQIKLQHEKELEQSKLQHEQKRFAAETRLERYRFVSDIAKWAIVAVGTVISFYVLDLGKLELERQKAETANQQALLTSYMTATDSPQPEIWKRKLKIISAMPGDEGLKKWADAEIYTIETSTGKVAVYKEVIQVASRLLHIDDTSQAAETQKALARFEELYWVDLPAAQESQEVAKAMVFVRSGIKHYKDAKGFAPPDLPSSPSVNINPKAITEQEYSGRILALITQLSKEIQEISRAKPTATPPAVPPAAGQAQL